MWWQKWRSWRIYGSYSSIISSAITNCEKIWVTGRMKTDRLFLSHRTSSKAEIIYCPSLVIRRKICMKVQHSCDFCCGQVLFLRLWCQSAYKLRLLNQTWQYDLLLISSCSSCLRRNVNLSHALMVWTDSWSSSPWPLSSGMKYRPHSCLKAEYINVTM